MTTILQILVSPRPQSFSRRIASDVTARLVALHPRAEVIERDLAKGAVPSVTDEFVGAMYTPADQRTPMQHMELGLSDKLIAELKEADVILIGSPMYNFSISSLMSLAPISLTILVMAALISSSLICLGRKRSITVISSLSCLTRSGRLPFS